MIISRRWLGPCGAVACAALIVIGRGEAIAGTERVLRPGAYEITFQQKFPDVNELTARRSVAVCVVASETVATLGLGPVSDDIMLNACPARAIRMTGSTLTFEIVCQGTHPARARARYKFFDDRFEGWITVGTGARRLSMTEVQLGKRTGPCPTPERLRPGSTNSGTASD